LVTTGSTSVRLCYNFSCASSVLRACLPNTVLQIKEGESVKTLLCTGLVFPQNTPNLVSFLREHSTSRFIVQVLFWWRSKHTSLTRPTKNVPSRSPYRDTSCCHLVVVHYRSLTKGIKALFLEGEFCSSLGKKARIRSRRRKISPKNCTALFLWIRGGKP